MKRDVFICHASEDKQDIVNPLVEAFSEAGISCWFDMNEISWGDSITQKVNEGLRKSRYVIVILSSASVAKNWPQRELNAVLNMEASLGEVKVLPLLVGSERDKNQILNQLPLLNDKRYLSWDGNIEGIVSQMLSLLGRGKKQKQGQGSGHESQLYDAIPMPQIKKQFTQHDKDMFVKSSFVVIRAYFKTGLAKFEQQSARVQTDFSEKDSSTFIATIYIGGHVASRCKIWIGGISSFGSIAYRQGRFQIDGDNSLNDWLSVDDDGQSLGFKTSGFHFGGNDFSKNGLLSVEESAEYLWRRFTESIR